MGLNFEDCLTDTPNFRSALRREEQVCDRYAAVLVLTMSSL